MDSDKSGNLNRKELKAKMKVIPLMVGVFPLHSLLIADRIGESQNQYLR